MQGEEHNDSDRLSSIMRRIELACSSIQVDATAQSQVQTKLTKLENQMNSVELKLDRVLHLLENSTKPNSCHVGDIGESPMIGKRSIENEIETAVSSKKQKVERDETVVADESDLDSNPKDKCVVKEQPATVTVSKKTIIADSSSESDTDDNEEEKEKAVTEPKKAQKKPTQSNASKHPLLSEESGSGYGFGNDSGFGSGSDYESDSVSLSYSDDEPQTTPTPKAKDSKTLFVDNLSFAVKEFEVRQFFKDVVDVRLSTVAGMCKGFGYVEFATAEAAKQAMELNAQLLLGCPVRLELAQPRHSNL